MQNIGNLHFVDYVDHMVREKWHLGERLHTILLEELGLTKPDFSHERVARAMIALNEARAGLPPMVGEVLWMSAPFAFTLPGPYVYITRRFIERCTSDAPVAFLLAHEIAHHDLGHLKRAERWMTNVFAHAPALIVLLTIEPLMRWLYSRENELAADSHGLDLCRKAGYDLKRCLQCFNIFELYLLDIHDLDGVYGTDEELELEPKLSMKSMGRIFSDWRLWRARHRRAHPSIHERRRVLMSRVVNREPAPSFD
jgi:Zn-dependent protease with chaperone function